jgi:hypothetical protein
MAGSSSRPLGIESHVVHDMGGTTMNNEAPGSSSHGRTDRGNPAKLSAATPPVSLVIVGVLFCLQGIAAALATAVLLVQGHVNVDLTFLCLFVGVGLLRRSTGCRTWALVFIWIGLILIPLAVLVTLSLPGLARYGPIWPIGLLQEILLIWMLWVLRRADVLRHFEIGDHAPPPITRPHTADSWEAVTDWETIHHWPATAATGVVNAALAERLPQADRAGLRTAAATSELELNEAIEAVAQAEVMPQGGRG